MKDFFFVLRILRRNPLMLFVNVIGLGLALATCILSLTYIRYELSYDAHFKTYDRVVRLFSQVTGNTSTEVFGISLRKAYTELPAIVPEIDAAFQFYGGWPAVVQSKDLKVGNARTFYADKEIFKVFGLTLRNGDAKTALNDKKSAVITTSLAQKLFKSGNCLGNTLVSDGEKVMVTGIIDDLPKNSHFNFDILISLPTLPLQYMEGLEFQTYYLFKPNTDQEAASVKIANANNLLMRNWAKATNSKVQSGVEPLRKLYLQSIAGPFIPNHGSLKQILIIALIALFVMITALVSYINLFIIHGEKRLAEISTRSMFGASRFDIARLFFTETCIIFVFSALLAFLITYFSMPYLPELLLSKVDLSDLISGWGIVSVMIVLLLLLIITSGYPVLYLSKRKFTSGLRGKIADPGKKNRLSVASVLVQFTVTTFLIICVVIIFSQIRYMQQVPKGFACENVHTLTGFSPLIAKKYESVRNELLKLPFIALVSGGEHFMGGGCSGQYIRNTWDTETENKAINEYREKPGFGEVMQLQLIDGRFVSESRADSVALVLNESAMKLLGLKPKAAQFVLYNNERFEIVGVVKDFYYMSNPGEPVAPLAIANCFWWTPNIYIRCNETLTKSQISQVKAVIQRFDENAVFNCQSLSDVFDGMYVKENRLAKMVFIGTLQVVLISLISLLALTVLKIARRTKEIGIRKVLGSTVSQIIRRLLVETLLIVSVATIIASGISFIVMNQWLMDYAKHIRLCPGFFLLSAICALFIAIAATVGQSWYAATRNPVDSIRLE